MRLSAHRSMGNGACPLDRVAAQDWHLHERSVCDGDIHRFQYSAVPPIPVLGGALHTISRLRFRDP
jgi:hypothetical protein